MFKILRLSAVLVGPDQFFRSHRNSTFLLKNIIIFNRVYSCKKFLYVEISQVQKQIKIVVTQRCPEQRSALTQCCLVDIPIFLIIIVYSGGGQ